jgi:hypothetical protein
MSSTAQIPVSLTMISIGLSVTLLVGLAVKPFLRFIRQRIPIPDISTNVQVNSEWKDVYAHPDESGFWVGQFERLVLYFALLGSSWELVGIWVGFKVASKWEAWNHMGYVPERPADDEVSPLAWAKARRIWAAQGYATFIVGTATNGLLAAFGVALARNEYGWLGTAGAILASAKLLGASLF